VVKDKKCELCELHTIINEYYRDENFIILDCMSCRVPMIVPWEHIDPKDGGSPFLRGQMEKMLVKAALKFYGGPYFYIDKKENKIPDHMHWHARRKGDADEH